MALANACILFGVAHRLHGDLLALNTSLGWLQILAKSNEGDVCLFYFFILFYSQEGQCLQWSHLARSLGLSAHYEVQLTTTNSTTTPHRLRCKYLHEGACFGRGDLLKVQPGHSILGPRKLWNAGALKCVIHFICCLYIMMGLYSNGISSKTMASQRLGNQCKGLSPSLPDATGGIQVSRQGHSGL